MPGGRLEDRAVQSQYRSSGEACALEVPRPLEVISTNALPHLAGNAPQQLLRRSTARFEVSTKIDPLQDQELTRCLSLIARHGNACKSTTVTLTRFGSLRAV